MSEVAEKQEQEVEEKVKTDEKGQLTVIRVGDQEYNVVNTCTMMEIMVHKLEDGREISQVVAHDFMMADHKQYMVRLLTDAIMTVMRAKKQKSMIHRVGQAVINRINRERNKKKGGGFGGNGKIIT